MTNTIPIFNFYKDGILRYIEDIKNHPLSIITFVIDLLILLFLIWKLIRIVNKTRSWQLIKGIVFLLIVMLLSEILNMYILNGILTSFMMYGVILLIVIFQPEIRNALEYLGRSQLLGRHKVLTVDEREKVVYEITNALDYLKKARIGALIVIERDNSLNDYIEKSRKLYADISADLLIAIFFPNNPLHDGGVIIQGDKITSAGAVFPTSDSMKISKRLGTRHRAALGIAETGDCIALIVSEETGRLSIAMNGELHYNLTLDDVKLTLLEELRPKKTLLVDDEEEEESQDENN